MLRLTIIVCLLLCLATSNCHPIEEPTKFPLNPKETTVENVRTPSKVEQAQIIAPNNVASAINGKSELLDDKGKSLESLRYPPSIFSSASNRQRVHLENESEQSLAEKTLTLPFNDLLLNFFKPTPLVDRIREEDKYGNSGDKMSNIGRALVNGYESFSNFLNSAFDSTKELKKTVGANITDALNQIGGKLVGLQ